MKSEERTEEALQQIRRLTDLIVQNIAEGVFVLNADGCFTFINPAAAALLGYQIEELVGQHWTTTVPPDQQPIVQAADERRAQGRSDRYELELVRKDGTRVPIQVSGSPRLDPNTGQLIGTVGVFTDLSERKGVEEHTAALMEANDHLRQEVEERRQIEAELRKYQEHLEELVEERTAQLRKSEERYRTLFDGVPVGLYRSTPAGQLVDANLAMVEMLGYPSRDHLLATSTASTYMDPKDRVHWGALMEQEGVVRDFEVRLLRYDGSPIWVSDSARAVKDRQGQILYFEGSLEDITERKQAQDKLRKYREHLQHLVEARTAELAESEKRYRTLFDGIPIGLYRSMQAGQLVDANLALVEMLGYPSRDDLLATSTASQYVDAKEQLRWKAMFEREGVVRDFEVQFLRYDGSAIWVSDTARAVRDEHGRILYYEGSVEDITRRKGYEEEIRRQKEYFEALFVNNPVAVVTADLEGTVVTWNPRAEKLFDYTEDEAVGRKLDDLVATDDSIRGEAAGYTEQVINLGRVQVTTKRTRKDGSLVDVELLALPVILAGEKVGFIAIYHDISDLQKARRQAEAASQAKSVFLANMSHELRTPLNAILGFTQLLDGDRNLTPEQREYLGIINRSGEHLLNLINDVLEVSKIEAGQVTMEETVFDLYHLLDGLEEMFRLRAERKGLVLILERSEGVPRHAFADESKLRQVLVNLLGNAVKFTEEGGVALRVTASPHSPGRAILRFEAEDTGPGIAPEALSALFDPFVQARGGQQPTEGTGLGLAISRQYVQLMGGDIGVSSSLGQGSIFRFDVQIGLVEAADVPTGKPVRRALGLAPDQPVHRLLVAENDRANRRLLVDLLEPLGFQVREAVNGQDALEAWDQWEPHLIWMDMRMPVMDGYEATQRIKATPKGQATVIIAVTASAFEEDRERVLSVGCDDFVRKPFRTSEILDILTKHLAVQFVYEQVQPDAAQPADMGARQADVLTPAALAALPADWLSDLQQAAILGDEDSLLALIDRIREQNDPLAEALAKLVRAFEHDTILNLVRQARRE